MTRPRPSNNSYFSTIPPPVSVAVLIAFGAVCDSVYVNDNDGDVEMLRCAGHGVAMSGSADVVLDAADEVAASNDDDGVARVIERMLAQA